MNKISDGGHIDEWFSARGCDPSRLDEQVPYQPPGTTWRNHLEKRRWAWEQSIQAMLARDYDDDQHIEALRQILIAAGDMHGVEICELALGIAEDAVDLAEWHFGGDPTRAKARARDHCLRWLALRHVLDALGAPEELVPQAGSRQRIRTSGGEP